MRKYDAVILAGGVNSGELRKCAPFENEALIIIGNSPMISYVYRALKGSDRISKIVISSPGSSLFSIFAKDDDLIFTESGDDAMESLANALSSATSEKVLVLPADIPFITPEAINDFLDSCEQVEADVYYAIVPREVNEARFPKVKRTYVKIQEGIFTGGNLFVVRTEAALRCIEMGKKLVANRKHPLAMVKLFGMDLVFKYITGRLSIPEVEKRFQEVMGVRGKAVFSNYAEVGVDVDKPSDLRLAEEVLGRQRR